MRQTYFAYGSNMHLEQMKKRCPQSLLVGPGLLWGYRWIITTRGYANIVVDYDEQVEGLLFSLTQEDERRLDGFEGVGLGCYNKVIVSVQRGKEECRALTYIDPVISEGKPREEYVERINKALADARLSPEYIARAICPFLPAVYGGRR